MPHQKLLTHLDSHSIAYTITEHEPLFTVEQSQHISATIPGAHSKNLFLRDKKKNNYFLVTVLDYKRVNLKALSKQLGKGGLSFGSSEDMQELLGVQPGAVTPFGLLNDVNNKVAFALDKDFMAHDIANFHPLRNDMTLSIARDDLMTFCKGVDHEVLLVDILQTE